MQWGFRKACEEREGISVAHAFHGQGEASTVGSECDLDRNRISLPGLSKPGKFGFHCWVYEIKQ